MSKTPQGAVPQPPRRQLSRAQREQRNQRIVLIGTAVVAGLIALILLVAAIDLFAVQPNQTAVRIGDTNISVAEFQKATRYRRFLLISRYSDFAYQANLYQGNQQFVDYFAGQAQQIAAQLEDSRQMGQLAIDDIIDDRIIRAEANKRGITASAEEIETRIREQFGFFPNGTPTASTTPTDLPTDVPPTVNPTRAALLTQAPTLTPTATLAPTAAPTEGPSPTPSATPTAYTTEAYGTRSAGYYSELNKNTGLTDADIRYFVESQLLREKLIEVIAADVPNTEEQVHARHILVADEATIKEVQTKLAAGGDWAALAAEYSTDTSNKDDAGDLGWFGAGRMVPEFETVAFSTAVGAISDPVESQFGWHLIQVLDKQLRPLSGDALETKRQAAFDNWLAEQRVSKMADGRDYVQAFSEVWQNRVPTDPKIPTGSN